MKAIHIIGILILAIIIIGGAAVLMGSTDNANLVQPIKVGFIGPLTGDAAVYGLPAQNMVALAVDEINAQGGVDGRIQQQPCKSW